MYKCTNPKKETSLKLFGLLKSLENKNQGILFLENMDQH